MKRIVFISAIMCLNISLMAQLKTYKISVLPTDKKLEISSGASSLNVESHDGNDIIITSKLSDDLPEEAEGLKPIVGGSVDNTNTGANVNKVGQVIKVKIPKTSMYSNFTIKVPKSMSTKIKEFANSYCTWNISGLAGELEAKTSYSSINITDATGPLLVHSDWGKVKVIYTKVAPDKPNSLYSNGGLDVTLPADCKANLNLLASFGNVYTDFDIAQKIKTDQKEDENEEDNEDNDATKNEQSSKIKPASSPRNGGNYSYTTTETGKIGSQDVKTIVKVENNENDSNQSFERPANNVDKSGNKSTGRSGSWGRGAAAKGYTINRGNASEDCNCDNDSSTIGTINGGGVDITLRSDHSNIYLRKKK